MGLIFSVGDASISLRYDVVLLMSVVRLAPSDLIQSLLDSLLLSTRRYIPRVPWSMNTGN